MGKGRIKKDGWIITDCECTFDVFRIVGWTKSKVFKRLYIFKLEMKFQGIAKEWKIPSLKRNWWFVSIFIKIIMFCNQSWSGETFKNVSFDLSIVGSDYAYHFSGLRTVKLSKINW